jgi:hypothetical protein
LALKILTQAFAENRCLALVSIDISYGDLMATVFWNIVIVEVGEGRPDGVCSVEEIAAENRAVLSFCGYDGVQIHNGPILILIVVRIVSVGGIRCGVYGIVPFINRFKHSDWQFHLDVR